MKRDLFGESVDREMMEVHKYPVAYNLLQKQCKADVMMQKIELVIWSVKFILYSVIRLEPVIWCWLCPWPLKGQIEGCSLQLYFWLPSINRSSMTIWFFKLLLFLPSSIDNIHKKNKTCYSHCCWHMYSPAIVRKDYRCYLK